MQQRTTALWMAAPLLLSVLGRGCPIKNEPRPMDPAASEFAARVESYVEATKPLRADVEKKVPKGKTPTEQASALDRKRTLLASQIKALRKGAKVGDLFSAEGAAYLRKQIDAAFQGEGAATIRDGFEEQNDPSIYKGPARRVALNARVSAPLAPAVLTVDLPPLPEQVEYRFLGRTLLLTDAEATVVLDYLSDVFPEAPPAAPQPAAKAKEQEAFAFFWMPRRPRSVRFAVLGDTGTGDPNQRKVAEVLWDYYAQNNRFKFALLVGDNLYAALERAEDYRRQFLDPYKKFLEARVMFYATLGNHDLAGQVDFEPFHMGGKSFYSFKDGNAKFISLNSNDPTNPEQLAFLEKESAGENGWKICFFHHPLFTSGRYVRESLAMRRMLEDPLVKAGVQVVFNGHEHFYERSKPEKNVHYFVCGSSSKLRRGEYKPREWSAFGYDKEHAVVLGEISGDTLFFQALGVSGRTIDCGALYLNDAAAAKAAKDAPTQKWLEDCKRERAWVDEEAPG